MELDEAGIVEYEREREKWILETDPNAARSATGSKKSGCLSVFIYLVIGLIAFRVLAEILYLFGG